MTDEPLPDGGAVEFEEEPELEDEEPSLPPELDDVEFSGDAPDPEAIAVAEDFRHKRGSDREILPVWETVPGTERQILVRPITQGAANEWLDEEDPDPSSLSERDQMNIVNEFIVWPDFDLKKPSDMDDFGAFGLDPLVMTVYNASGWNYARGMLAENYELVQMMEGNLKTGN